MRDPNTIISELHRLDDDRSGRLEKDEILHLVLFTPPRPGTASPNRIIFNDKDLAIRLAEKLSGEGFDPENAKDISFIRGVMRLHLRGGVEEARLSDMCSTRTGYSCRTSKDGRMVTFISGADI